MSRPSPYAREMGNSILKLVTLFDHTAPDPDFHHDLKVLVADYEQWSNAHQVWDSTRDRLLSSKAKVESVYYTFAESCLASIYNETNPADPFDTVSPFWIVPHAMMLAQLVNISVKAVVQVV